MVMIVASMMASGRPIGIMFAVAYMMSSMMTHGSSPLPTNSSMYFHTKFIIRTKITMKKVIIIGPR